MNQEDIETTDGTIRPAVFIYAANRMTLIGQNVETKRPFVVTVISPFPGSNGPDSKESGAA